MSVTTTQYTTNSYKITLNMEMDSEAMLAAVDTAVKALGWSAFDTVGTSSAGQIPGLGTTSTYSPIRTYVYRALNFDGVTYKYIILRFDTIKWQFWHTCAESWNATTHVATNESWNNVGIFVQNYDLRDGFLWIGATSRHFVIWPFIRNEPGMWTGTFEFERVASEDTSGAGYPCFAWTNSLMIGTPYGNPSNNVAIGGTMYPSKIMFAFPRTPDGFTGVSAAQIYAPITSKGMHPPSYPNHNLGALAFTSDTNLLHLGSHYNWIYAWDTFSSKTSASPFSLDAITKIMPFGRAFNLSVTAPIGSFLDTTSIPVSATGGWADPSGTAADCVLLPMNGGPENYDRATSSSLPAPSVPTTMITAVASGQGTGGNTTNAAMQKTFAIGANVWAVNNQGVWVWNTITSTMPLVYSSTGMRDIIFDGQRTVWGATSAGVVRIDTETLAATAYTMTAGTQYLAIDRNFVYATSRTTSTNPAMYAIRRSDFSLAYGNFSSASTVVVVTIAGTPQPDYQGGVYLASVAGTVGTTQTMRIYKNVGNEATTTWVETTSVFNPHRPTAGSSMQYNIPGWWFDPTSGKIFLFGNSSVSTQSVSVAEINTSTLATVQISSATNVGNASNNNYFTVSNSVFNTTDYFGDMNIVPFRGALVFGPKMYNFSEGYKSLSLNSPYLSSSTSVVGSFNGVALTNALINANVTPSALSFGTYIFGSGSAHTFWSNGPRVYFCTDTATTGQSRYWSNVYSLYNLRGGTSGRLAILG